MITKKPMDTLVIKDDAFEVIDASARSSIEVINEKLDTFEITLSAESWSGSAPYTYAYTKSGVNSNDSFEIIGFTPTNKDSDNEAIRECLAYITYGTTSANTITFVACTDVPTIDLPIVLRKV